MAKKSLVVAALVIAALTAAPALAQNAASATGSGHITICSDTTFDPASIPVEGGNVQVR